MKLPATLAVLATVLLLIAPANGSARSRGDVQVLALVPTPGFPALPHVVGDRVFEGTYDNPSGDTVPSRVLEYAA